MAGPGGGPPRRSHTKSRKGCETCKKRHIRCDESFPQCRNCTKHKIRCPYNDVPASDPNRSTTPDKPDLMWTPEIEASLLQWQQTNVFPFPSMGIYPVPVASSYSWEDLRLIYHIASVYDELSVMDANNFTLWTRHIPIILRIGATTPYVMHALLAFSAMHIAFLTDCPLVGGMGFEHRGVALSGLQEAIGVFSRDNSDAILAASLVLSWQATDWSGWNQLMQGTSTIMSAMEGWKNESQFVDFIAESRTFPTAPPSPSSDHRRAQPRKEDLDAYQSTLEQVQKVEAHLKSQKDAFKVDTTQIQNLVSFLKGSRKISHTLPIAQQFERLRSLRDWLFWMPVAYLQNYRCSPNSLVAIAHLYTVAILMERLFPEIGSAYFGSLSLVPVEEIARRLMSYSVTDNFDSSATVPLRLMDFPIDSVGDFRARMGWVQPERTQSFPTFQTPSFRTFDSRSEYDSSSESYGLYGNPAFSYSHESMPVLNAAVSHTHSPVGSVVMPSPYQSQPQYLNMPSPMYAAGPYSPTPSHLDGSVTYSDTDEYRNWDMGAAMQAQPSPIYHDARHSFGAGFVSPTTTQPVWI
ncbi:uncharacterized protein F5Z01DRAFT_375389 [Emericellopsis atlantica]|uniref:Zn(2)-C6 fungal-type domain-containing protein n=1 Tax=Emericellopsis atlantica TaxID=2614577 RepID=A0A9P7ZEU8_9HYPO|nr:uncharacterized protein F5Z01DRAFT_375389 [Emericellopsis atlantica]KAG9250416.1 hypothetical protein F5Z01DRAFT_375389 [Emericellopsis atlantica]